MKISDFLNLYQSEGLVQTIAQKNGTNNNLHLQLKGLKGSMDAILAAAIYQINQQTQLFVLHDKEEAAYFHTDLQNLLEDKKEVLLFPSSYKKPYQFEKTENANILMRAEILNRINNLSPKGELIVTYPEALTEKVINKKSLVKNTLLVKRGDELDTEFLYEILISYDFEPTEFVYEAGQFAVRGGIVDVFSYAGELPFRIELFGNEIESIRTFDPISQLSTEQLDQVNIIPNVQTRLLEERREGFLNFLPKDTKIWIKDYGQTLDIIEKHFQKAEINFKDILEKNKDTTSLHQPSDLFENRESISKTLQNHTTIEFGNRFYFTEKASFQLESFAQPSFNKNFELLANNLSQNQEKGFTNIIVAEQPKQLDRLKNILEEIDPFIKFQDLNISLREGFIDPLLKIACYTDHQIFDRYHRYKTKTTYSKSKALTLKELRTLSPGDYVVHVDYGVGRFAGLEKMEVAGKEQEAMRLIYRDNDLLYVSVHSLHKVSKYSGKEGGPPTISKLGTHEWENKKKRVKSKVKDIAKDLIRLYAKRKNAPGFAFEKDGVMQTELESSFIYEDTPDQAAATTDVKADMELAHPMDRLVCGDVGFGKTEVAIRAAFKAVNDGKQVAVLVPTTILAMQHFHTFSERLKDFPVQIEYINRFKSTKAIKESLKNIKDGFTDILIGTHRIVNKDVDFKDLGLMIIDEEQKFGVKVKERLKEIRINVDSLTLTATPIPRTLHFSLMGARDLSIIATPPPNRQPVTTEIHAFSEEIIRDAIDYELKRGGQVFFVHNHVSDIEQVANIILRLVPDAKVGVAHGQMDGTKLEKTMLGFINGDFDVLVSTNIIESGLDIPNANTIIINKAHMFGLSDLHQMRGRVGRSNKKAFCHLLSPPTSSLTSDARKRLSTLEEFSELGSGFKVAMRDLDIRGAGNLLGGEQSGFITDIGFDMYHKILDEAVQELKETEFKDLFEEELKTNGKPKPFVQDCTIETDLELLIPEEYVNNTAERLSLYSKLDNLEGEEQLKEFCEGLKDRFGPMPDTVQDLIETVRLRWIAEKLGFEKLVLKNESLKGYFPSSENEIFYKSEIFGRILNYIQNRPKKCKIKEYPKRLLLKIEQITSVQQALQTLTEML
ncbi:transcription-repair coupling factor [Xanthovirga aplysinae]|uniref:transcription-repair coupling factor n=1 Tax=Xanthovirga aplysinae TaxID=2529853 RepID=UPI0012BD6941|nr:transcription-repair coupling factor [Xanthovirga aplysinae]MTI30912.1 transcription-repair coupling factor [Xanthovirga aplysinae]